MVPSHLVHVTRRRGHIQTLIRLIHVCKAASAAAFSKPVARAVHGDEPYQHQRATDGRRDDDWNLFSHKIGFHITAGVVVVVAYVNRPRPGAERFVDLSGSTIVGLVEPDIHEIGVGSCRVCDGEQLYVWAGRSVHAAVDKIPIVDEEINVPDLRMSCE